MSTYLFTINSMELALNKLNLGHRQDIDILVKTAVEAFHTTIKEAKPLTTEKLQQALKYLDIVPEIDRYIFTSAKICIQYLEISTQDIKLEIEFILDALDVAIENDESLTESMSKINERVCSTLVKHYGDALKHYSTRLSLKKKYLSMTVELSTSNNGLRDGLELLKLIVDSWSYGRLAYIVELDNLPKIDKYSKFIFLSKPSDYDCDYAYEQEYQNYLYLIEKNKEEHFLVLDYSPQRDVEHTAENLGLFYRVCWCFETVEEFIKDSSDRLDGLVSTKKIIYGVGADIRDHLTGKFDFDVFLGSNKCDFTDKSYGENLVQYRVEKKNESFKRDESILCG